MRPQFFKQMGFFAGTPSWTAKNVPDLTGKTFLVTGGNTGIGKETCRVLLTRNANVIFTSRSQDKAAAATTELIQTTGKKSIKYVLMHLDDLRSVAAAAEVLAQEPRLHVMILNAGVMMPPPGSQTSWGNFEQQWGTNVLGHFLLVNKLLPLLERTVAISSPGSVRIVSVASSAHLQHPKIPLGIDYDAVACKNSDWIEKYTPLHYYGMSKLGNLLLSNALAQRYQDKGILCSAVHPGFIRSELQRHVGGVPMFILDNFILRPVSYGALTQLYAATSPEMTLATDSGTYRVPWSLKIKSSDELVYDQVAIDALWRNCEKEVALKQFKY